ncbi:MAG: phycobilisome linker polypeptide [Cyanobacteria bacterium P01_A01_bin.84]
MAGMTTTGIYQASDYKARTALIEVTGMCRQDIMKRSNYTVKVPYTQMSQAMQNISRMGGKVKSVSLVSINSEQNSENPSSSSSEGE